MTVHIGIESKVSADQPVLIPAAEGINVNPGSTLILDTLTSNVESDSSLTNSGTLTLMPHP